MEIRNRKFAKIYGFKFAGAVFLKCVTQAWCWIVEQHLPFSNNEILTWISWHCVLQHLIYVYHRSREFVLRLSWEACENICGNKKQINDKSTKAITNAAFKWYSFYRNLSFAADKNIIFRFITVWNLTLKVELIYLLHLWLDLDYPKRCKTVLAIICYLLFAYVLISHTPFPSAPPPHLFCAVSEQNNLYWKIK